MYINLTSFNKNIDSFLILLDAIKVTWEVIILSETWQGEAGVGVQLEGYKVFKTEKGVNRNDGVGVCE